MLKDRCGEDCTAKCWCRTQPDQGHSESSFPNHHQSYCMCSFIMFKSPKRIRAALQKNWKSHWMSNFIIPNHLNQIFTKLILQPKDILPISFSFAITQMNVHKRDVKRKISPLKWLIWMRRSLHLINQKKRSIRIQFNFAIFMLTVSVRILPPSEATGWSHWLCAEWHLQGRCPGALEGSGSSWRADWEDWYPRYSPDASWTWGKGYPMMSDKSPKGDFSFTVFWWFSKDLIV